MKFQFALDVVPGCPFSKCRFSPFFVSLADLLKEEVMLLLLAFLRISGAVCIYKVEAEDLEFRAILVFVASLKPAGA